MPLHFEFIGHNGFILLSGILMISLSWGFNSINGELFALSSFSLPNQHIVAGCFIIIIAFFGFYSGYRRKKVLIKVYLFLMSVLLAFEVNLMATTYNFSYNADVFLTEAMENNFVQYGEPGHMNVTDSIDRIQEDYYCCGVRGYSDWEQYPFGKQRPHTVPDTCCHRGLFADGCGVGLVEPSTLWKIKRSGCVSVLLKIFSDWIQFVRFIWFYAVYYQLLCGLEAVFLWHALID